MPANILDNFKLLFTENINNVKQIDLDSLWSLNNWIGNEKSNLKLFVNISEGILAGVPKSILIKEMFLNVNKHIKFIKYPKDAEKEIDELEWLKDYFTQYYKWSKRETNLYWNIIKAYLSTQEHKEEIAKKFGLNDKERKLFGLEKLEVIKLEIKKEEKKKEKILDKSQARLF
jgi:hypothetical protein